MEALNGLFYLIAMVVIGYGAAAVKLLPEKTADVLPSLLFDICYPAMILETFLTIDTEVLLGTGLPVVAATVAVTLALFFLGLLVFRRVPEGKRALLVLLTGIGNVTYVALPLFSVMLSAEALLAAILHSTAQDPLIWGIYHPMLLKSTGGRENLLKKVFTSPCLLATLAGIALCAARITPPSFVTETMSRISAATSPLALLLIGILVRQYGVFSWVRDKAALVYGILKVIALPCLLLPVLSLFLPGQTALLLSILFGSPAPLLSVAWAKKHGQEEAFTLHCFLFSTLLYLTAMGILIPMLIHFGLL